MASTHSRFRESSLFQGYEVLREEVPCFVLLMQLGQFFEAWEQSAHTVSTVCDLRLTHRCDVPIAGVPLPAQRYVQTLLQAGYPVALAVEKGGVPMRREIAAKFWPGQFEQDAKLRVSVEHLQIT